MTEVKKQRVDKQLAQEGIAQAKASIKTLETYISIAYRSSLASGAKATARELRMVALELAKVEVRLSLAEIGLREEQK